MLTETDLRLPDGRTLHCYDTGPGDGADLVVVYHHGTPNVGPPPAPLVEAPAGRGIRWISYDRPGYGGSARDPGRTVATTAADDAAVADALGIDRFAVLGHSSGAVLALAAAAALPGRVL
ncbi:alpha/beta fold hydrolase, partial [Clavibacter michiganensis]